MLKFTYGTMGSSKTIQALVTAHNYQTKTSRRVYLLKPALDTRSKFIKSRIGLKAPCFSFAKNQSIFDFFTLTQARLDSFTPLRWVIIVDEAQFCSPSQVGELRQLAAYADVFCFGLKTNFMTKLFAGSQRLLELADVTEELTMICSCGKNATINALFKNGQIQTEGDEVQIGDTEYKALCYDCYQSAVFYGCYKSAVFAASFTDPTPESESESESELTTLLEKFKPTDDADINSL